MRRVMAIAALVVLATFVTQQYAFAVPKQIANWQLSNNTTSWEVDDQGSLFEITAGKSGGVLTILTYSQREWKNGKQPTTYAGSLNLFPATGPFADCTVAGFYRRKVLLRFVDALGTATYATYLVQSNQLKPYTNPGIRIANPGETNRLLKTVIVSYTVASTEFGEVETINQYNIYFKLNKNKTLTGKGLLEPIDYRLPTYWKDVSGTLGTNMQVGVWRY